MQLSALTHEIRNLLQPVDYHVSVMAARPTDDPQIARALSVIPKQLELLQQLLANVSIYTNPIELNPRRVELRRCIQSAVNRLNASPETRDAEITLNGLSQPTFAMLDEYWIPIALEHLFRNAIEAVAKAGDKKITVDLSIIKSVIYIRILDCGPGIDAQVASSLFQPFATTKEQAGAGFGLALTKKILEAHGGTVTLSRGTDPVATCATVTIPFVAAS